MLLGSESFHLLSKYVKIKMNISVILPVFLYIGETLIEVFYITLTLHFSPCA
jgi:hypothetical protein